MRHLVLISVALCFLAGCASEPIVMQLPPPDGAPRPGDSARLPAPKQQTLHSLSIRELQTQLGLNRNPRDLGFEDKSFDGCRMGVMGEDGTCGHRFLSVVHFRLVCRETTGTTSRVPANLKPLVSGSMQWRLAGTHGVTSTDNQGFGQVQVISSRPIKGDRFILIIGSKSLGLEAGEVTQIVLPGDWCSRWAMN